MNWKLTFKLSMFGLAMAILTVYFIPSNIEPVFWLIIFITCAYLIAKNCTRKYFLNGLMLGLFNCVWVTVIHVLFYNTYIENHQMEAQMISETPLPTHPKLMMLMTGSLFGIASGFVLGLFSFIASKFIKKII